MRKIMITLAATASMLTLGGTAAQAAVTPNATPACAKQCLDIYSRVLGRHTILNAYVPGDTGIGGKAGQKINLNYAGNTHPNEDFTLAIDGTVGDYCGTELAATSVACIDYRDNPVVELDWTPYGNQTDLCAGTSGPLHSGENLTLRQCGVYEGTLLIPDTDNVTHRYLPLIDGADASFSHPEVLTVDPGTSSPVNQIKVETENKLTGGAIADTQLFTGWPGPAA
jgi:hypothetical protein